jgi:hypothetical protein
MNKRFLSALAAAILCVQSSFGQTVITSLPYIISSSGTFVLGSSLAWPSATGNAITIAASDVTLDLGGHYLSHAGTANGNVAVYVHNVENVTIQNGIIVAFAYGVYYAGTTNLNSGNIVQNLRLTNVLNGIFLVGATLSKVTNNQIINLSTSALSAVQESTWPAAAMSPTATSSAVSVPGLPASGTVICSRIRSATAAPV